MRVFVAGATGVIGRPLVEQLVAAGHDVTAMTRSPERASGLRARGIDAVVADAFDAEAVGAAVAGARPEVVINQLTALPARIPIWSYAKALEPTNRLRREAAPVLARAAVDAGARQLIVQSVSFFLAPRGPVVLDESAPTWDDAPRPFSAAAASMVALEASALGTPGIEGVVLRYGYFYGPGSSFGPGGSGAQDVARRQFPVAGSGAGRFSFVHVDDAAAATVLALDHGAPGIYNVTDDEPVAQRDWVPAMAAALGAKPPRHVPALLASLLAGPGMAVAAQEQRGASNAKARRELGWVPAFTSYREGFAAVFGGG